MDKMKCNQETNDHNYYGNPNTNNSESRSKINRNKNTAEFNNIENFFIDRMESESEMRISDSELNDYEVIEEEIVENSSSNSDESEEYEEEDDKSDCSNSKNDTKIEDKDGLNNTDDKRCTNVPKISSSSSKVSEIPARPKHNAKKDTISSRKLNSSATKSTTDCVENNARSQFSAIKVTVIDSSKLRLDVTDKSGEQQQSTTNPKQEVPECTKVDASACIVDTRNTDVSDSACDEKSRTDGSSSVTTTTMDIDGDGKSNKNDDVDSENRFRKDDSSFKNVDVDGSTLLDVSGFKNVFADDSNDVTDEMDVSDVSSSIAENESTGTGESNASKTSSPQKKPRIRQPPIMMGYKKRRKITHVKKHDEENSETVTKAAATATIKNETAADVQLSRSLDNAYSDESKKLSGEHSSSSEENLYENSMNSIGSTRPARKDSSSCGEITSADKYCWICHKDSGGMLNCIACPRIFHFKCHLQQCDGYMQDTKNFYCPECSAVLKADNVNTRSPVLSTVNLDQLCTLLKHIVNIMKIQKDSQIFWGPVDLTEFPHYRDYVVYPMDISLLENNVKNKVYGCTDAFLADVKWIVHNSIVFNSKAAKITNVAKNLLKICKREIQEIETCAECYYNSLVRKDTWFVEVCKKPHLLVWARLKGYPPWPAKAMKCKDEMVDCRFFGAHDKAWVPVKDCFLYSKIPPQPVKVKKGSHLQDGIEELEKHIKKLKDKYGIFVYPSSRIPYRPARELEQLRIMLPNYVPNSSGHSVKYLIHPDRTKLNVRPKALFNERTECDRINVENESAEETEVGHRRVFSAKKKRKSDSAVEVVVDSSSDNDSAVSNNSSKTGGRTSITNNSFSNEDVDKESIEVKRIVQSSSSPPPPPPLLPPPPPTNQRNESSDEKSPEPKTTTVEQVNKSPTVDKDSCKVKKLVTVKNIESINASVCGPTTTTTTTTKEQPSVGALASCKKKPESSREQQHREKYTKSFETIRVFKQVVNEWNQQPKETNSAALPEINKQDFASAAAAATEDKSAITIENVVASKENNSNASVIGGTGTSSSSSAGNAANANVARKTSADASVSADLAREQRDFDLNKVKNEPDESYYVGESVANEEPPSSTSTENRSSVVRNPKANCRNKRARNDDEIGASAAINDGGGGGTKKSKFEANSRGAAAAAAVNIVENVTLSATNSNQMSAIARSSSSSSSSSSSNPKLIPSHKINLPVRSAGNENLSAPETNNYPTPTTKGKTISVKSAAAINNNSTVAVGKNMVKTVNSGGQMLNGIPVVNGSAPIAIKSGSTVIPPAQISMNSVLDECMTEFQNHFRKILESTLDKIAGKGDMRAKVILLKKEMDGLKRNQELIIDEIKRDYEIQIAELRATSVAKAQFDLAAEKLKFEQEKERAVKEAKSKQWCSNCQKIANYYCCWNTAYCDFECQKDHWTQHMNVCKNDVKKKTAEFSENEPPRIMMQNDVSNNYLINGYDKSNTTSYTYQNSNEFRNNLVNRIQAKNVNVARTSPKPILPRTMAVPVTPVVFSPVTSVSNAASTPSLTAPQRKFVVAIAPSASSPATTSFNSTPPTIVDSSTIQGLRMSTFADGSNTIQGFRMGTIGGGGVRQASPFQK